MFYFLESNEFFIAPRAVARGPPACLFSEPEFPTKKEAGEMEQVYFITINGEKVRVSEEVYRAFKRPAWRERKRRQVRDDHELSLEVYMDDDGSDIPSDQTSVEEIVENKLMLDMLIAAMAELSDDERGLLAALFFAEKSEHEVASETGIPQTTLNYRKNQILSLLKNKLM